MKMSKVFAATSMAALSLFIFTGVGANASSTHKDSMSSIHMSDKKKSTHMNMDMTMDGLKMNMNSKMPKGLKKDTHAKYHVGEKVTLKANHMAGMKNTKATVAGVYKTKLYKINFKPTNGGKEVKNHKWVVAKELSAKGALKSGENITVKADHMVGMKGAKGKIVSVNQGPAYAVNFKDSKTGMMINNHKWLVQSELKAR
ncbi:YdhK family protein [Apilactobacillus apisilvae]|uniref:YdhK family protein n=1 Tax=Apilactobacillus apisilvae TaxID=2923364 RepID=A0ABY4PGV6_9LACO|nr:YdhK family protein [Apilactobacillus apisilvae]UQS84893.1 YdhK family protein [Apilactobacillus apisilvae]